MQLVLFDVPKAKLEFVFQYGHTFYLKNTLWENVFLCISATNPIPDDIVLKVEDSYTPLRFEYQLINSFSFQHEL